MVLTAKQQQELDASILAYLRERGATGAAAAFQSETGCADADAVKAEGALEKKWTSVIRLQKKVMDLEAKVEALTEEVIQMWCCRVVITSVPTNSAPPL